MTSFAIQSTGLDEHTPLLLPQMPKCNIKIINCSTDH